MPMEGRIQLVLYLAVNFQIWQTLIVPVVSIKAYLTAYENMTIFADGVFVGSSSDWTRARRFTFPDDTTVIAISGVNSSPLAKGGILASFDNGLVTDSKWKCTKDYDAQWTLPSYNDSLWAVASLYGTNNAQSPWGYIRRISSSANWIWTSRSSADLRCFCRLNQFKESIIPALNFTAQHSSQTSINVTWGPLSGVEGYIVKYWEKIITPQATPINAKYKKLGSSVTSTTITNLKVYTLYSIQVWAFTSSVNGTFGNVLDARTAEGVPSVPPPNVNAFNISSTSIRVTWSPVSASDVNGVLDGYSITYWEAAVPTNYPRIRTVTHITYEYDMTNLKPFTSYSIHVRAYTAAGQGPSSPQQNVTSDEDVPDAGPDITVIYTGITNATLSWTSIPESNVRGILLGYVVNATMLFDSSIFRDAVTGPLELQTTLEGLKADTQYDISVSGFTRKGLGTEELTFISTKEGPSYWYR